MRYDKPPITMLGARQIVSMAGDGHDDDDDGFLPPSLLSGTISVIFISHEGSDYRIRDHVLLALPPMVLSWLETSG